MDVLDICMILIFVIVMAVIFGLSVISLIDQKISNVSVNIPKIEVPKSTIIVNIQKDGNNDYHVNVEQKTEAHVEPKIEPKVEPKIESLNGKKQVIETFVSGNKEPGNEIHGNVVPVTPYDCNKTTCKVQVVEDTFPVACGMKNPPMHIQGGYNFADYYESASPIEIGKKLFSMDDIFTNIPVGYSSPYSDLYQLS